LYMMTIHMNRSKKRWKNL